MDELDKIERLSETEKINIIIELNENLQNMQIQIHKLEELQNVFRLWIKLKRKLFPSNCSGLEIRDISLDILAADVAGCVEAFLTSGKLEQRQRENLYYSIDCLDIVLLELQSYESWYFKQMKTLSSAIIEYEKKW